MIGEQAGHQAGQFVLRLRRQHAPVRRRGKPARRRRLEELELTIRDSGLKAVTLASHGDLHDSGREMLSSGSGYPQTTSHKR